MNAAAYIRLGEIAHARSGDKGNRANIGVIANRIEDYEYLRKVMTADVVSQFLRPMQVGSVVRHELPKIGALNFVVENALGGGASRSLQIDTQGKALGTAILELMLPAPSHEEAN